MHATEKLFPRPYRLTNQIQPYAWGTRGAAAFIPQLLNLKPKPGRPYAELWIGAHPKAPSTVQLAGEPVPLDRLIAAHPQETLGAGVAGRFAGKLPFLLKILSAAESLSIQAHPNKAQAERLHARDPQHYPDANHKPEIAIALDTLTALVGFKPFDELRAALHIYPELAEFVGAERRASLHAAHQPAPAEQEALIGALYATLIQRALNAPVRYATAVAQLAARLMAADRPRTEIETRFLTLREKYGDTDVGLLSLFLFNLVQLQPGEALFTPAGVPHAYLEGNIIECMANSDNVVRAGLTPKFTDVATLLEILTPATGPVPILERKPWGEKTRYETPATEFQVNRWTLASGTESTVITGAGPEIYLLTQGHVTVKWGTNATASYQRGESFFIPACLDRFCMAATSDTEIFSVEVPISK